MGGTVTLVVAWWLLRIGGTVGCDVGTVVVAILVSTTLLCGGWVTYGVDVVVLLVVESDSLWIDNLDWLVVLLFPIVFGVDVVVADDVVDESSSCCTCCVVSRDSSRTGSSFTLVGSLMVLWTKVRLAIPRAISIACVITGVTVWRNALGCILARRSTTGVFDVVTGPNARVCVAPTRVTFVTRLSSSLLVII